MSDYILECCVDSFESACNASAGGADRLELCANLAIGGTTPGISLFRQIRRETGIRMHVLIRPRFGDFCYTEAELVRMEEEIAMFRQAGAEAVVIGVLQPDGELDLPAMKRLIKAAGEMDITLHRAFDMCRDPFRAVDQAVQLGVRTILTSGQMESAWEGRDLLKQLIQYADGRLDIMAGGGVNAEVIGKLQPYTGGRSFHMSGKIVCDSPMEYRKEGVHMGLPGLSEYETWLTSQEKVEEAVRWLRSFSLHTQV